MPEGHETAAAVMFAAMTCVRAALEHDRRARLPLVAEAVQAVYLRHGQHGVLLLVDALVDDAAQLLRTMHPVDPVGMLDQVEREFLRSVSPEPDR